MDQALVEDRFCLVSQVSRGPVPTQNDVTSEREGGGRGGGGGMGVCVKAARVLWGAKGESRDCYACEVGKKKKKKKNL